MFYTHKVMKKSHPCKSEFNKIREKQVIWLIILGNEKQNYVAVKNLNVLNTFVLTALKCLEQNKN